MKTVVSEEDDHAHSYCANLVARGDEDFHLSSFYALGDDRLAVRALFAFLIELRRIPAAVSEPPLGEIRLQWLSDALDEIVRGEKPRAHPVIEALAASNLVDLHTRPSFERMIEARARLLYEPSFSSLDELSAFLAEAEAPIAGIAARGDFAGAADVELRALAYALARFAPIYAPSLADAACDEGRRLIAGCGGSTAPSALVGRLAFLALARGYAARPRGQAWPLAKRAALFSCVLTGRF